MKNELQILVEARELIADESHWTQNVIARDKTGEPILDTTSDDATCWCVFGAVCRASDTPNGLAIFKSDGPNTRVMETLDELARRKHRYQGYWSEIHSIIDVNDQIGHTAVIALMDEAIEKLTAVAA